ncbi:HprK-related kinase A [Thalassotalea euphylliae]|uniref:HprK-related kinase A n=1 Tax=Thalassotalea euphylliae TaxID=1655234 RepID=A0A3E0TX76_9GAMM|nr:HprK-related kinase A [Thalassotalea euphylliae]REL28575.1 HprK-related kinase A [Thalassotalea euphylliae]
MKLKDLTLAHITKLASSHGIGLAIGPFNFAITTEFPEVIRNLYKLYSEFKVLDDQDIIDFQINIRKPNSLRRWFKPQALFYLDGKTPFLPLPANQAFPLLEWGMNWCIAQHTLDHLSIHAGVLERDGVVVILPAISGSGKSTLTAILVAHGWRLLSDEMTLVELKTGKITPLARPISLKNQSIDLVTTLGPDFVLSDLVKDTNKGSIAHLKPTDNAVDQISNTANATTIIFPRFEAESAANLNQVSKGRAFMKVIENCFNYGILGEKGFTALEQLVDRCECYEFVYSKVDDAVNTFNHLNNIDKWAKNNE